MREASSCLPFSYPSPFDRVSERGRFRYHAHTGNDSGQEYAVDQILKCCKQLFDRSSRAFGIARVNLDDAGNAHDVTIVYLNAAMAATAQSEPEDLLGKNIYEIWPDGDRSWLDFYYRAAYCNEAIEFETVSVAYQTFQNVAISPIAEGYCSYEVQDITRWMESAHLTMENVMAGLFFYEPRTGLLLLTDPARECCGLDVGYLSVRAFAEKLFEGETAKRIYDSITMQSAEHDRILCEEQIRNGKWIRLSLAHMDSTSRFSIGFLEDITLLHEAESNSARRSGIIESLSSEYFALYIIDLDADEITPYILRNETAMFFARDIGEGATYSEWLDLYCNTYVNAKDASEVHDQLSLKALYAFMEKGSSGFSVGCRRLMEEEEYYIELRVIKIAGASNELVLAARNINDEVQKQINQNNALQSALTLAQHASDAKTTFLTNMSHDFRTPLNSVMGFTELALADLDDRAQVKNSLEKITVSGEHLLSLINDILDVSRIESGKVLLKEEPFDLLELLGHIRDIFTAQAIEKGITFMVRTAKVMHPHVLGDQLKLNQILVNVIGNAMKYTQCGGHVDVNVSEGEVSPSGIPMFTFVVEDDGCGMSEDFLNRLFMPFERDDTGNVRAAEGTGLGMTITKNLIDLIGGTVKVKSKQGSGTRFDITLPIKLDLDHAIGYEAQIMDEHAVPEDFGGLRVLIVDDDELSREMLSSILTKHGFIVEQASDGRAAVEAVSSSSEGYYDALIMDMRMPGMTGDEAASVIRSLPRVDVAAMPIIAATADAFAEGHRRAHEAGMTAHITKPINSKRILALLADCLHVQ